MNDQIPCLNCAKIFNKDEIEEINNMKLISSIHGDSLFSYTCCPTRTLYRYKITVSEFVYLLLYNLTLTQVDFYLLGKYRMFKLYSLLQVVEEKWDCFMFENKSNWRKRVLDCLTREFNVLFNVSWIQVDSFDHVISDPLLVGLIDLNVKPGLFNSNVRELLAIQKDGLLVGKRGTSGRLLHRDLNRVKRTKTKQQTDQNKKVKENRPSITLFLDVRNEVNSDVVIYSQLTHSAPQISISADGLEASNPKGYRMAKASHGVREGCWYFEVEILSLPLPNSNVRIGYSQISGDLQAPCGYDSFSYSFRTNPPTVFHESKGTEYGASYGLGDRLGVLLYMDKPLPEYLASFDPLPPEWDTSTPYESVSYYGERPKIKKSFIKYFINGVDQGIAFDNLFYGKYYPAFSMFNGAKVRAFFKSDCKYFSAVKTIHPEVSLINSKQAY